MHFLNITNREREVLELVAHEYTTPEIASRLYLSNHTVDNHKKKIKLKLDVKNTAGMIRKGFELGLLRINRSKQFAVTRTFIFLFLFTVALSAQEPFVLTFETEGPDEKVIIPIQNGFSYDYEVDWNGDGLYDEQFQNSEAVHTFLRLQLCRLCSRMQLYLMVMCPPGILQMSSS